MTRCGGARRPMSDRMRTLQVWIPVSPSTGEHATGGCGTSSSAITSRWPASSPAGSPIVGEAFDDLLQVALLGLLKAVERFEPDRGLRFSTFATPTILGELKRHFRDRGWAVRVPRRVQELHVQLAQLVGSLEPGPRTITHAGSRSRRSRVCPRRTCSKRWKQAGSIGSSRSTDRPDDETDAPELSAQLGEDDSGFERIDQRIELQEMLEILPERERTIVILRFFDGLTQSEIASRIGMSQMHVSRLLKRSLDVLRSGIAS